MFKAHGIQLHELGGMCPEQFYAYFEGSDTQIGYIRVRHDRLTVDVPDAGDFNILTMNVKGGGALLDEERTECLNKVCLALAKHLGDLT